MTTFPTRTSTMKIDIPAPVRKAWQMICQWRARIGLTASLRRLKKRELRDIGLIEHDITAAKQLPLSSDAATSLYLTSVGNRRNW